MSDPIRVLVADYDPVFRVGVMHALQSVGAFEVVGEAGNAADAIQLARQLQPGVVLLGDILTGCRLQAAAEIARSCPTVRIVVLTTSESEESVTAALEAGAQGYILKGISGAEFAGVLRAICAGEPYVAPTLAARLLAKLRQKPCIREKNVSDLTAAEEKILALVSLGLTNKEVARKLSLSEKTVKHYMTNVLHKLQVRNRVEAIIQVRRDLQLPELQPQRTHRN